MGRELTDDTFGSIMQFIKFGIVGVSNTAISYVIYVVGLVLLQEIHFLPEYDYLIAQIAAFVISVLWSFYWNSKMVFTLEEGKERSVWKALIKTFIAYSFTGLFLNSILLFLWVRVFSISEFIAPLINLVVSVPLNFIINKFWAFRQA
ncbi:GtrA family protein [bacterium 1xD42-87]|nr:GtrA family protein [bacterium 1xD42-87]